ncbi:MAG: DUF4976 domain-containing protein [Acidobacteria bacterium]|nr:DUF4976 domain-containing protein [Acidobacteriota bacterium]
MPDEMRADSLACYGNPVTNEQPAMVSRSAMIRTQTHKLILRPQGQSELYSYREDPREERNLYGDQGSSAVEAELTMKLLKQFINTTAFLPWIRTHATLRLFIRHVLTFRPLTGRPGF